MTTKLEGVVPLTHLGVIRVEGVDAARFLQSQLTQDLTSLGPSQARLAAYCNAKGRMLASFFALQRGPTEILLVCSRDLLADTVKRLSMFVLRAKARLSEASADFALYGLAGDAIDSIAGDARAPWSKLDIGAASVVILPGVDSASRGLWVAPVTEAAPTGISLSQETWLWGEVRSAIAMISAPIVDRFVPQMLNYESVGGVSFKKGCYPGQEVVARSQFRGTLKRRAYLAHSDEPMSAGDELFQIDDETQPCGSVAQAAKSPGGGLTRSSRCRSLRRVPRACACVPSTAQP